MNTDFQIAILKKCAEYYPFHALDAWDALLAMAPGDSPEAKQRALVTHLWALDEFGYIKGFVHGESSYARNFTVTGQGLIEAGVEVLHPDPYAEMRETLLAQAHAERALSQEDAKTLRGVLSSLPRVALERLRDKGLDLLLDLVFG